MPLVTWNICYSTGYDELDQHHRHLITLLNRLHNTVADQLSGQELTQILDALTEYTRYHFFAEETLMQNWHYPDFHTHKHLHDQFVIRLRGIQAGFAGSNQYISMELLTFLQDWVLSHIQQVDAKFGKFLSTEKNPQEMSRF